LSFINSDVVHLPKQMQRGLAFLPGKWDADMAQNAAASNDFRRETWGIWMHDYFPARPWLGRGFGFRREWAKPLAYNPKAMDYRAGIPPTVRKKRCLWNDVTLSRPLSRSMDRFLLVGRAERRRILAAGICSHRSFPAAAGGNGIGPYS